MCTLLAFKDLHMHFHHVKNKLEKKNHVILACWFLLDPVAIKKSFFPPPPAAPERATQIPSDFWRPQDLSEVACGRKHIYEASAFRQIMI